MRIVSLLPSATEIICRIGLGDFLVGVSHECDYPNFVTTLPAVTKSLIPKNATSEAIDSKVKEQLKTEKAIYHLDMEILASLNPDIIVTQSLCEVCAVAASEVSSAVCELGNQAKIINLEPMSLQDVFDTMLLVGKETGFESQAEQAVRELSARVEAIKSVSDSNVVKQTRPGVVFLEWIEPLFNAGHWTPELIHYAGGEDLTGNLHQPSSEMDWQILVSANPDVIFIACCGFDINRTLEDMQYLVRKQEWSSLSAVEQGRVYITDGNAYFSRPGPRLVDGLEIMANTFHPAYHSLPSQLSPAIKYPDDVNELSK